MTMPLHERFLRRLEPTVRRTIDTIAAEVPYYGMLPREVLDGEIAEFTRQNYRVFARVLVERRKPTEAELAGPLLAGSRRAQEDIPLPALLAVYSVAARVGLEALRETANPDELEMVLDASSELHRYLQLLVPAVAVAYLDERQTLHGTVNQARRELFDALVDGTPWSDAAERASVTLALSYNVLHLYMPEPASNTIVARRRMHRVQDAVDGYAREPVLASLDGRGGTILLPVVGDLEPLLHAFAEIADGAVTIGLSEAASPEAIAIAAEEARELVVLAVKLGRGPGLYRLSDLLVEYQLTRAGRAHEQLAAMIQPLIAHPHLLEAVSAYLQHEHSRQLAAKSLHVHPNTLDYRLRRVSELTGLDPARASSARVLAAALLAVETR